MLESIIITMYGFAVVGFGILSLTAVFICIMMIALSKGPEW